MLNRNARSVVYASFIIALLAMLAFTPVSAQLSQWRSLNPTRDGTIPPVVAGRGLGPNLYSVHMLTASVGWAVGGSCDIYAGTTCTTNNGYVLYWDGSRWRQLLTPVGTATLTSVFAVGVNDVWAVGWNATIIHWDGTSWVRVTAPAGTGSLYSVFMLPGGTDGWAVGNGVVNNIRWSGTWPTGAWTAGPVPNLGPGATLRSVFMSSSTSGWSVGQTGVIFRWDGAGWMAAISPTANDLFSVHAVNGTDAWAVGAASTIIRWNGASWTGPMVAPTVGIGYRSIHMISTTNGWIAGALNPTSGEGLLLQWNGSAWSVVRSYVTVGLNSVFFLPGASQGSSVGNAETIIYWNGSSWYAQTSPTVANLNALFLVSSSDGWAVGSNGTVFRWNGQSWHHYETLPSGVNLYGLFMRTSVDVWAVGAHPAGLTPPTILRWNGVAWTVVSPPGVALGENLTDVCMLSANEGWAVGTGTYPNRASALKWDGTLWASVPSGTPFGAHLRSVRMLSSSDGWAVGANATGNGPVIVHWNGLAWNNATAPAGIGALNAVQFLSQNNGWAVGNSGTGGQATIIHWDGTQWTRVSAPTGNLTSLYMVSGSDGWAVGNQTTPTMRSLIVHWNGLTWDVVATMPLPSTMAVTLRSVFMTGALEGWIAGDEGLILKYGPDVIPATTTSTQTSTASTTITQTMTSTATTSITTSTSQTATSTNTTQTSQTTTVYPPVPGYPTESILAGLLGGIAVLTVLRRARRIRS